MTKVRTVATSIVWFLVAGGSSAVLVPWWLTGWRVRHPLPWPAGVQVIGALLVVPGLLTTMLVFAEFVRAGGTPMPGAITERLVVTGMNRYVRNPIYVGALAIFLGEALVLGRPALPARVRRSSLGGYGRLRARVRRTRSASSLRRGL